MTRLAVVIPALNEEATIGEVVASIPRRIAGVHSVEVIVVDDGSRDDTAARAIAAGADAIVRYARNRGLAAAFVGGTSEALRRGSDVVVTMDADGQHDAALVSRLADPVVTGKADIVVGVRPLTDSDQGTTMRRIGNRVGSWAARRSLGIDVTDVTSGFRAFSRDALLRLNLVSGHTYTVETLIQAARKRLAVVEVPARARHRRVGISRMTNSIPRYIARTGGQAVRSLLHNSPLGLFGRTAALLGTFSLAAVLWFLVGYARGGMHLPALLAAVLLAVSAGAVLVCGLLADGISANRRLLEDVLYRIRTMELERVRSMDDDFSLGTLARKPERSRDEAPWAPTTL